MANPRTVLKTQLEALKAFGGKNYELFSAHELEFTLMKKKVGASAVGDATPGTTNNTDDWEPASDGIDFVSTLHGAKTADFQYELQESMYDMGVDIGTMNAEYGDGQLEITYAPSWGLQSGDNTFTYKNGPFPLPTSLRAQPAGQPAGGVRRVLSSSTLPRASDRSSGCLSVCLSVCLARTSPAVKEIAMNMGLHATFMAKPFSWGASNGGHTNHSLWTTDASGVRTNAFADADSVRCRPSPPFPPLHHLGLLGGNDLVLVVWWIHISSVAAPACLNLPPAAAAAAAAASWQRSLILIRCPLPACTLQEDKLSQVAKYWIGGLLKHLPALQALGSPTMSCYNRVADWTWAPTSGAYHVMYICTQKRNAPAIAASLPHHSARLLGCSSVLVVSAMYLLLC
jgi:hypothetical protein